MLSKIQLSNSSHALIFLSLSLSHDVFDYDSFSLLSFCNKKDETISKQRVCEKKINIYFFVVLTNGYLTCYHLLASLIVGRPSPAPFLI